MSDIVYSFAPPEPDTVLHSERLIPLGISYWPHPEDGSISYFLADGTFVYLGSKQVEFLHRFYQSGRWWDCELCAGLADLVLTNLAVKWRDMSPADSGETLDLVRLLMHVWQRS